MSAGATLNVRFSGSASELKKRGDAVLEREGISTSEAIRRLYAHLDETQTVPSWMKSENTDIYESRRQAMREFLKTVSDSKSVEQTDLNALRDKRLSKYTF